MSIAALRCLGSDPTPDGPLKLVVVGPEKIMVTQVLLSLRNWTRARCTAICSTGSRYLRHSPLVDGYAEIRFDGRDDERFVDYVNSLEKRHPGQIVLPADTVGNRLLNRVRPRLSVRCPPLPDDALLDVLDDKWEFHRLCTRLGLPTPPTLYAATKHDIDFDEAAAFLGLPFFLKPVREAQSHGACEIGSADDLRRMVLDDPGYDYAPLLLQRFIRGPDVGVNVCAFGGRVRAIAMQRRRPPQLADSPIDFFDSPELARIAQAICAGTGYDGVMNIDARIEEATGRVWLLEANPRYWRSLSASTWAGLNFVAEHLGRAPPTRPLRVLRSGEADTFHHPLLRPRLWPAMLTARNCQGRMARRMAADLCTLANSMRILVKGQ